VEVLVTLTVMSLITVFVVPALAGLLAEEESSPVEGLRVLLRSAQARAVRNGSEVEVWVSGPSGRYRVEERRGLGPVTVLEGALELGGVAGADEEARMYVVFRPGGMGLGDTLWVDGWQVRVDGLSGEVEVDRLEAERGSPVSP